MKDLILSVAIAENGVIGKNDTLPWSILEGVQQFKRLREPYPVILGKRTYTSIVERLRGPLPNRRTIVLSKRHAVQQVFQEVVICSSLEDALQCGHQYHDLVYVFGGRSVYEQALPHATRLEMTEVKGTFEGDVFFPEWNKECWEEHAREDYGTYAFVTYTRKPSS